MPLQRTSDYRHRIQFQKVERSRDDRLSSVPTWSDEFKWWASYDGATNAEMSLILSSRGSMEVGRTSQAGARFKMRPIPASRNVAPDTHRIVTPDGLAWDIVAPAVSNSRNEILILGRRVI